MLFLWFLILTKLYCVVNCNYVSDSYVLEMPDSDVLKASNKYPFKVYWNVPTKQCKYQKNSIPFDDVLRKYSITFNKDDKFEGETITIIYDGGYMPAILSRDGVMYSVRNGGLPQAGDLELHLTAFRETVMRLIPDPNFKGLGVIDMEKWRPIFRQHWSELTSIIDLSLSIEKRQYWWWPTSWLKMEATKRFEDAARIFMEKTLSTAKQMRPKALWGYYGFPYCFNMAKDMKEHCSKVVKEENDRTYWLWAESTALYPSLYSTSKFSTSELEALVRGRLVEANRVKQAGALVLPYFWLKYRDGKFFREEDLIAVFETLRKKNASGVIIWGSSNDVNQFGKCKELYDYVNSSFGPIARKFIKRINMLHDENTKADSIVPTGNLNNTIIVTTHKTISNNNRENTNNNPITTEKSENISYNIIEQHQLSEYLYETDNNNTDIKSSKESIIWDIISYDSESIKQTNPEKHDNKTQNVNQEEQVIGNTITQNTETTDSSDSRENDISDYLITADANFNNTENTPEFTTSQNIETPDMREINFSDYLIAVAVKPSVKSTISIGNNIPHGSVSLMENSTSTETRLMSDNDTDIIENVKSVNSMESMLSSPNNFSRDVSLDVKEDEKLFKNTIYPHIDSVISIEKDILDGSVSLTENSTSPVTTYKKISNNNRENTNNTTENTTENTTDNTTEFTTEKSENISYNIIEQHQLSGYLYETDNNNTDIKSSNESSIWNIISYDSESIKQTNPKKQLNKYFYELDDNKTSSSNDSDIWSMSDNDTDIIENVKAVNSLESMLSLPNNFSRDGSLDVKEDEQLFKIAIYPNVDSVISIENDISDSSVSSTEISTSPVTGLISGNYTDTVENMKIGNSLESTLSLSNNFSRDIPENVKQDEQLVNNTTNPSVKSMISRESDVLDGSVISTENSTTPVTRFISGNYTDIIVKMKAVNSLESMLSLANNFSRDISQDVGKDEQLFKNTTSPSVQSTINIENNVSDSSVSSTANSTSPVTELINGNYTDIIENVKAGNSLESTLSLPNNFSRDISENVKEAEQLFENTTYPNNEEPISSSSDISDNLIVLAKETSPMNTSVNNNDVKVIENVKPESILQFT